MAIQTTLLKNGFSVTQNPSYKAQNLVLVSYTVAEIIIQGIFDLFTLLFLVVIVCGLHKG